MVFVLSRIVDGRWHPGIGDPSIGGWLTVVAYFVAAAFSLQASRRAAIIRLKWFWLSTATILVVLGINKQLDLQSWITEAGRRVAVIGGWYEQRAHVQRAFITTIALGGFGLIVLLAGIMWQELAQIWLGIAGLILLVVFILIRAMSFHHVDQWICTSIASIPINWILELGGIAAIGFSALHGIRARKIQSPKSQFG